MINLNRLKELRKEKKLTQQELADIIGVTKRTYIYWEKGERIPKSDKAQQLADYFGVSVAYLLGYQDDLQLRNAIAHNSRDFDDTEYMDLLRHLNNKIQEEWIDIEKYEKEREKLINSIDKMLTHIRYLDLISIYSFVRDKYNKNNYTD